MPDRPFRTAAAYYCARPPYSDALRPTLRSRLGWSGQGRLLDVGSGPGTIALELASEFAEVVALDPEPAMLAQGRLHSHADLNIRWVEGRAEDIRVLGLTGFVAVTFGQSLHRTDRESVIDTVHEILNPGGALVLIHHTLRGFGLPDPDALHVQRPAAPAGVPEIPYSIVWEALDHYLEYIPGLPTEPSERHDAALERSIFKGYEKLVLPGRRDVIRTPEGVVDMFLSTSFAAPERFGDRLDAFRDELLEKLRAVAPDGNLWEWPGDTEVLVAIKRG